MDLNTYQLQIFNLQNIEEIYKEDEFFMGKEVLNLMFEIYSVTIILKLSLRMKSM